MSIAIVAAAQGQGVALASPALAGDDLASGRLVAPFEVSMRTPFGYYFLCRPGEAETPRIGRCGSFWSKRQRSRQGEAREKMGRSGWALDVKRYLLCSRFT